VIAGWAISGPVFGFSDTWQLVATQLKLDELIRSIGDARNQFIGAESEPEERIKRETKEVEAEKDKLASPAAADRQVDPPSRNGKPHNGEPAGHR
jgi:low affinity Fe/Cu permease